MARIELASQRWQRRALPLCYTCGSAACAVKVPLLLTITSVADAGPYGGCVTNTAAIWWRRWVLPPRVQPCKGRLRPSGIPKKKIGTPRRARTFTRPGKSRMLCHYSFGSKKGGSLTIRRSASEDRGSVRPRHTTELDSNQHRPLRVPGEARTLNRLGKNQVLCHYSFGDKEVFLGTSDLPFLNTPRVVLGHSYTY